jgi:type IV pilus assembly protein PilE
MEIMNKQGFTLIELLIVIGIIGILAVVATTSYVGSMLKADRSEAYTNLESLRLLEEQFFAENARYTTSHGVAGSTVAIRDANLLAIQTTAGEALPAFQPGTGAVFSYRIINTPLVGSALAPPVAVPWAGAAVAQNPCFIAVAEGVVNTRPGNQLDVFVIDCNNNKNF